MRNTLHDYRGIAVALCLLGTQPGLLAGQPAAPAMAAPEAAADARALSRAYLRLRTTPGHFSGGAWNADVDAWGGRKQRVMEQLAGQVLGRPTTADELRALMARPDEVMVCPTEACKAVTAALKEGGEGRAPAAQGWGREAVGAALAAAPGTDARLWLYDWRGRHDRLVFVVAGGQVRAGGWWYAGE